MTLVLEESEDISSELILCLLDSVKTDNQVNVCLLIFTSFRFNYFSNLSLHLPTEYLACCTQARGESDQ